jgi:hypothetical protein
MRILRRSGREVTIDLVDDLDGTKADETVRFELDGRNYEIELSVLNAAELRSALVPYIDRARAAEASDRQHASWLLRRASPLPSD